MLPDAEQASRSGGLLHPSACVPGLCHRVSTVLTPHFTQLQRTWSHSLHNTIISSTMLSHILKKARFVSPRASSQPPYPHRRALHKSSTTKAETIYPASLLASEDAELAISESFKKARAKFAVPASKERVAKVKKALEDKGHIVSIAPDKDEALEIIKKIIPDGASVNLSGSTTLVRLIHRIWLETDANCAFHFYHTMLTIGLLYLLK